MNEEIVHPTLCSEGTLKVITSGNRIVHTHYLGEGEAEFSLTYENSGAGRAAMGKMMEKLKSSKVANDVMRMALQGLL